MTAVLDNREDLVDRQRITADEAQTAIANAIDDSGYTLEELRQQASEHRFETVTARLAWMTITAFQRTGSKD